MSLIEHTRDSGGGISSPEKSPLPRRAVLYSADFFTRSGTAILNIQDRSIFFDIFFALGRIAVMH
ncbi:hypothetical protein C8R32_10537 [Nitrosospira sp. Nsp5]|uniref:Uncharacterized protein n=1 Tax=Nitrosospira multiformis TaxID=1231 RepID=A0ABY0TB41_9PROT|nr:hypothetical protein C8R32_10537 [Nitrosospira sp. Nsp5]SDQ56266.1 hypothetical protein SAMN05216402_1335 [Nitrosospira multiformis]